MSTYRTIEVRRIAGALGAEIHGVDLARTLPDETVAEIRRAFLDHLVIFFHGQTLSPGEFMAFARRMGQPIEYPFVKGIEGFPEVSPGRVAGSASRTSSLRTDVAHCGNPQLLDQAHA
jgi:taurine dioxygenase